VCASISGFGQTGPYAEQAAHDINYQALAGLLRPPQLPGPLVSDIGGATQAAIRILAALVARAATGAGAVVDVAIHDAAIEWSMFPDTAELANACYNVYETADGEWLALGALEVKFWTGFCERIGRPDLICLQHAGANDRDRVLREVRDVIRSRTRDEWLAHFAGADVCLTPIYTREEVVRDPHVVARAEMVRLKPDATNASDAVRLKPDTTNAADVVRLKPDATNVAGVVSGFSRTVTDAPALGADTDAVLEAAGIGAADRARLRSAGVI
jgi:crotonobetainyl-CoA:carnitine CoA-transferase CaiB-like acyl-CoA transferase